ncbi:lysophospholipid acyltransferase family protein [Sulfurospirillum sp. 1307]|jgi:putative hemolysin
MVNIQKAICVKYPAITNLPFIIKKPIFGFVKRLIRENEINAFLKSYENVGPFEFVDGVLDYFNFSYKVSSNQIENIPCEGRVIIIANHPLGALDALSLINLVKKVRSDVKVLANDVLAQIDQLKPILLSIDAFGSKTSKQTLEQIYNSLDKEEAIIIFPSGEVSRARPDGIKDTKWHKGFLKFALKKNTPILPIYIKAKNSAFFYTISTINKKLSASLLPWEMFNKKNKSLEFVIGEIIPFKSFEKNTFNIKTKVKLFKKHLYNISKNKTPIFATQKCIAHPEDRKKIKEELNASTLLGKTSDGKKIYLYEYENESSVMKEISRLREFTFRKVEEGTGKKRDLDEFDEYYKHIVLWDEDKLEVIGSYRIGESDFISEYFGQEGFYSNSLFYFNQEFEEYLSNSIELGRSFVQPKYWGSRALDYLWQGIGAYLYKNPHIRYMFGPVSLSSSIPKGAQNLIIYYYSKYYGANNNAINPKNPFVFNKDEKTEMQQIFTGEDKKENFELLKEHLACYGVSVPVLYKQYTELCEEGGISFMGFNIDENFNNCVDSFIVVDIEKIKDKKRQRYIKGQL